MVSVATTQLGCRGLKAASHTTQTSEHGSVPIKLELERTLKPEFHISFMCYRIFLVILLLSQPSSNVKYILGLLAAQKQAGAGFGPGATISQPLPLTTFCTAWKVIPYKYKYKYKYKYIYKYIYIYSFGQAIQHLES